MVGSGAHAHQIRALSGIAAHLVSARDMSVLSGCNWFTAEILEMLAVIDGQIAMLEALGDDDSR
jgi:hypothetical protein